MAPLRSRMTVNGNAVTADSLLERLGRSLGSIPAREIDLRTTQDRLQRSQHRLAHEQRQRGPGTALGPVAEVIEDPVVGRVA